MGRNISIEHFTTSPHRKQECRLVPEGKMVISCWWTCVYVLRAESLREIKLVNRRFISAKNPLKRTKEKSLCDWVLRAHSRGLDPPGGAGRVGQRRKWDTSCSHARAPVTLSSPLGSLTLCRAAGHDNRVGPVTLLAPPSLPRKGMWSELRENTFRNIQPLMRAAHPEWQAAAAPGSAQNQGQLGPLCMDCRLPAHGPWPPRYPSTTHTHTHTHTHTRPPHNLPTTHTPTHPHPHPQTHTHTQTHTHRHTRPTHYLPTTRTHTHTRPPHYPPTIHTCMHTHRHTHTLTHTYTLPPDSSLALNLELPPFPAWIIFKIRLLEEKASTFEENLSLQQLLLWEDSVQFSCSVRSDSVPTWTSARQTSLSITNSRSPLKLMGGLTQPLKDGTVSWLKSWPKCWNHTP